MRGLTSLAMALWCLGCDPAYTINGRVTNCETGDEIVGVRVELYNGNRVRPGRAVHEVQTKPDGSFTVGDLGEGDSAVTLRFIKPGYWEKVVHRSSAPAELEECLLRSTSDDGDAGLPGDDEDAGG